MKKILQKVPQVFRYKRSSLNFCRCHENCKERQTAEWTKNCAMPVNLCQLPSTKSKKTTEHETQPLKVQKLVFFCERRALNCQNFGYLKQSSENKSILTAFMVIFDSTNSRRKSKTSLEKSRQDQKFKKKLKFLSVLAKAGRKKYKKVTARRSTARLCINWWRSAGFRKLTLRTEVKNTAFALEISKNCFFLLKSKRDREPNLW